MAWKPRNLSGTRANMLDRVVSCPPGNPAKLSLKLLNCSFSIDQLAKSNSTKTGNREIIIQKKLDNIRGSCFTTSLCTSYEKLYICKFLIAQVEATYPLNCQQESDKRWYEIVHKSLNGKCRDARKKVKQQ